jgi:4a-hydroxytetrahydrobiopterin dehydratase
MKTPLTASEIKNLLHKHPRWKLHEGKLVREWTFSNFVDAISFVNKVAPLAEAAGHHPDIDIRYNRVTLSLVSHDAGGITARDAAMAHQLDDEFQDLP